MVDFCILLSPHNIAQSDSQVPPNTPTPPTFSRAAAAEAANAIDALRAGLPCQSINHSDFGPLRRDPVAVSVETKRAGAGGEEARLQVGTWHAAQWKLLAGLVADAGGDLAALPFLPAVIVTGHDWAFACTTREGRRTVCSVPNWLVCLWGGLADMFLRSSGLTVPSAAPAVSSASTASYMAFSIWLGGQGRYICPGISRMCLGCLAGRRGDWRKQKSRYPFAFDMAVDMVVNRKQKFITNAGCLSPRGCAKSLQKSARQHGHSYLKVAYVSGNDVLDRFEDLNKRKAFKHFDTSKDLTNSSQQGAVCGVNAYIGAWPVVAALRNRSDVVVTG